MLVLPSRRVPRLCGRFVAATISDPLIKPITGPCYILAWGNSYILKNVEPIYAPFAPLDLDVGLEAVLEDEQSSRSGNATRVDVVRADFGRTRHDVSGTMIVR
jgi:hypothetical protein